MPTDQMDQPGGSNKAPKLPYLNIAPPTKAQFGFRCAICQEVIIANKSLHLENLDDNFFITVCQAGHANARIERREDKGILQ